MNAPSIDACLRRLYAQATQQGFSGDEADDLAQDLLLAALEQGRALGDPHFPSWAAGVLGRHALFVARTACRRRRREAAYVADAPAPAPPPPPAKLPAPFIGSLAPSLRTVALLANAGMGRTEIASCYTSPTRRSASESAACGAPGEGRGRTPRRLRTISSRNTTVPGGAH